MNEQRVFLFDQAVPKPREFPGYEQPMLGRWAVERGKPLSEDSPFFAVMVNELAPGAVLPWHEHAEDEEVYFIISGQGSYLDNGKKPHQVKRGDVTLCLKGEKHGLENTGKEPLIFGAAIAKK